MTQVVSSAEPEKLFEYAKRGRWITFHLDMESSRLAVHLQRFENLCTEPAFRVPTDLLANRLRDFSTDSKVVDEWVEQVGKKFLEADQGLLIYVQQLTDNQSKLVPVWLSISYDELEKQIKERQKEWGKMGLKKPKDTRLYGVNVAVNTVLHPDNMATIKYTAQMYDIPPDLLAAVLAAEIDFDYDRGDKYNDSMGIRGIEVGTGPGLANVHKDTLEDAIKYLKNAEDIPDHILVSLDEYDMSIQYRASVPGTIEGAAIVIKALIHYKEGQIETAEDKAVIFGAYRAGIKDFIGDSEKYGYISQEDFINNLARGTQNVKDEKFRIGGNAYQALPYIEFFDEVFETLSIAEAGQQSQHGGSSKQ